MANQTGTKKITVRYTSIDGASILRHFKTPAGARRFAHEYVGKDADVGSSYATSSDGVGKVTVTGITLDELISGVARTLYDLADDERSDDDEEAFAEKQERIADQGQIIDALAEAEAAVKIESVCHGDLEGDGVSWEIIAEAADGRRWVLDARFPTELRAAKFAQKVTDRGAIDLAHWEGTFPRYGSDAYEAEAGEAHEYAVGLRQGSCTWDDVPRHLAALL